MNLYIAIIEWESGSSRQGEAVTGPTLEEVRRTTARYLATLSEDDGLGDYNRENPLYDWATDEQIDLWHDGLVLADDTPHLIYLAVHPDGITHAHLATELNRSGNPADPYVLVGQVREGLFYLEHSPEGDGNPPTAGTALHRSTIDVIADLTRMITAAPEGTGTVTIRTHFPITVLARHEGTRGELLAYLRGLSVYL